MNDSGRTLENVAGSCFSETVATMNNVGKENFAFLQLTKSQQRKGPNTPT
jgi:hypothetical protein